MTTVGVDKTQWSFQLASARAGKGLAVYTGMPADKQAIMIF